MLVDAASLLYCHLASSTPSPAAIVFSLCATLYVWRLLKFTLAPLLDIEKPGEIPYWVPFLGHTFSFMKSPNKLVEHGLNIFAKKREPFAIKVLGEHIYVITSPEDAAIVYKISTAFSWDVYLNKLLMGFGLGKTALAKAWRKPELGESAFVTPNPINPQRKCMVHAIEDVYKTQLLPGDNLDELLHKVVARMQNTLRWDQFIGPFLLESADTHKRISVRKLCRIKMTNITTGVMYGDALFKLEPDLTSLMMDISDNSWAIVFGYPKFLLPKLNSAWKKLSAVIRKYWQSPESDRADASWAIRSIVRLQEQADIDAESRDALLLMISWAANANTVDSAFWLLSYLIFDPPLLEIIRQETAPAFRDGKVDIWYLIKDCPRLESAWLEVLRLVNGALSIRKVTAPINVGGKNLSPGNTIIIPFRQLHLNEHVWGDNSSEFIPERFLGNSKLRSHSSYRPFGGGVSFCPGRYLAMAEACGFVAMFLHHFDLKLPTMADGTAQKFPLQDESKPSTGIAGCVESMDTFIDVKPINCGGSQVS